MPSTHLPTPPESRPSPSQDQLQPPCQLDHETRNPAPKAFHQCTSVHASKSCCTCPRSLLENPEETHHQDNCWFRTEVIKYQERDEQRIIQIQLLIREVESLKHTIEDMLDADTDVTPIDTDIGQRPPRSSSKLTRRASRRILFGMLQRINSKGPFAKGPLSTEVHPSRIFEEADGEGRAHAETHDLGGAAIPPTKNDDSGTANDESGARPTYKVMPTIDEKAPSVHMPSRQHTLRISDSETARRPHAIKRGKRATKRPYKRVTISHIDILSDVLRYPGELAADFNRDFYSTHAGHTPVTHHQLPGTAALPNPPSCCQSGCGADGGEKRKANKTSTHHALGKDCPLHPVPKRKQKKSSSSLSFPRRRSESSLDANSQDPNRPEETSESYFPPIALSSSASLSSTTTAAITGPPHTDHQRPHAPAANATNLDLESNFCSSQEASFSGQAIQPVACQQQHKEQEQQQQKARALSTAPNKEGLESPNVRDQLCKKLEEIRAKREDAEFVGED